MLNSNGQIINGTMTAGGNAISGYSQCYHSATELAVKTLIDSTKTTIDSSIANKIDKVASATENNIAAFTANGGIKDSGMKAGGATLAETPQQYHSGYRGSC